MMLGERPADRFCLPRCESCGAFHFYPRPFCPRCGGERLAWADAGGGGEVYSYSVVHRAPSPEFRKELPYVVAIVKTDEGPHLLARVVGGAPESVRIGMRVRARMATTGEGAAALPVFVPEAA